MLFMGHTPEYWRKAKQVYEQIKGTHLEKKLLLEAELYRLEKQAGIYNERIYEIKRLLKDLE